MNVTAEINVSLYSSVNVRKVRSSLLLASVSDYPLASRCNRSAIPGCCVNTCDWLPTSIALTELTNAAQVFKGLVGRSVHYRTY
jgi:hypothetical protein